MKYDNLADYLNALELQLEHNSSGNEILRLDLQKDMALERLIARFDPSKTAVKGGFGIRTLVPGSPLTQDLDILISSKNWRDFTKEQIYQFVSDEVVDTMTAPGDDKFRFVPTSAASFADLDPDQAVVRIWAQVSVADKPFGAVIIDAGLKEPNVPIEQHSGRDVLAFAGVENPIIATPSREWLAADKLTLLLQHGLEGDRPRDAVHAALLIDGDYDAKVLQDWIIQFADRRGIRSLLTQPLQQPSKMWAAQIDQLCSRNRLKLNAEACFEKVSSILQRLFIHDS